MSTQPTNRDRNSLSNSENEQSDHELGAWLTPAQAAEYVGMSKSFLAQARMRGDPPVYVKIGRSVRYNSLDLDAWLLDHRVE